MAKKTTSFRLEPEILKKLKFLSFEYDKPIGDILEGLLNFIENPEYRKDPEFKKKFYDFLELELINAGTGKNAEGEQVGPKTSGWGGADGPTYKEKAAEIKKAQESEDK